MKNERSDLRAAFSLIRLRSLIQGWSGAPSFTVGIIDGPVNLDHPALAAASVRTVGPREESQCRDRSSGECFHGTGVAGILFARRETPAAAICPGCSFLLCPIFDDQPGRAVTPGDLASAILTTVDAGARIINLSLGVITSAVRVHRDLDDACDYASRRGVMLVAAAGNQGRAGFQPLLNHPWIIPVAACDSSGTPMPESNLSPTIGSRGFLAPGVNVPTTAPDGRFTRMSGTSAAAAVVTGALALVWSRQPDVEAVEIRRRAFQAASRPYRSFIPPLLNAAAANRLRELTSRQKESTMNVPPVTDETHTQPEATPRPPRLTASRPRIAPQSEAGACPTCAGGAANNGPATYIYAIGTIRMRFPSPGVEKEIAQAMAGGQTVNLTDQQAIHKVVKENRYLANEVCWVLSIENTDAYLLVPRDSATLDLFVNAVAPASRGVDVDVVIGVKGPMAPPEFCNGLVAPIVMVDQIYSFNKPDLLNAITRPKESPMTEKAFRSASEELFDRIQQMADNVGATDEHRAMNYLAVRYQQVYAHAVAMNTREFSLSGVEVLPSRLSGTRKLVDVVMTFTNRTTDVVEKYYVRVDVTEKFPFLDKKLSPYYDR